MIRIPLIAFTLLFSVSIHQSDLRGDDSFTAMTYNIRYASSRDGDDVWPNRVDTVANTIAQHDVVGLQEVTYPQLQDLQAKRSEFATYSVGREDGEKAGEHTTIMYRTDRFELIDQGTFWLSETPEVAGSKSWDAAITRICSWAILRDQKTNRKFLFANTHFDHRGSQARTESGKLIQKTIAQKSNGLPVILLGDFNCLPESKPYNAIIAPGPSPLVDARGVSQIPPAGPNSTWSGFRKIAPHRIIDHVFVAGAIEVVSLTVLNPKTDQDRFGSDHLPVQIVAKLKSPPTP